jgi:hypothetical protein
MALTKRQKRRLSEISRMIESSFTIKDDMLDMQTQYSNELEEVSNLIRSGKSGPVAGKPAATSDSSVSTYTSSSENNEQSDSQETDSSTGEHQSDTNFEPPNRDDLNIPSWAKALWKKIAMKCHPDRLNFQKLSAIDIARRQQWFLDSQDYFIAGEWNKLIHVGIQIDEWVEDLSYFKQHEILDTQYSKTAAKINEIQNSVAWSWGNNWDNLNVRVQLITVYCNALGVKLPDRVKLIEILVNFELE